MTVTLEAFISWTDKRGGGIQVGSKRGKYVTKAESGRWGYLNFIGCSDKMLMVIGLRGTAG